MEENWRWGWYEGGRGSRDELSLNFFLVCKKCGTRMFDTKLNGLLGGVCWRKGSLAFFSFFFLCACKKCNMCMILKSMDCSGSSLDKVIDCVGPAHQLLETRIVQVIDKYPRVSINESDRQLKSIFPLADMGFSP